MSTLGKACGKKSAAPFWYASLINSGGYAPVPGDKGLKWLK